jgi:hypothetical protein
LGVGVNAVAAADSAAADNATALGASAFRHTAITRSKNVVPASCSARSTDVTDTNSTVCQGLMNNARNVV